MWFDWRLDLFEALPDLDRALEDDEIAVPLLREFTLLADNKFTFDTIVESFNFGDPTEKQRIRMVPDANDERDQYLAAQTLNTIDQARVEIEITEEGYRALTYWFDRVTQLYDRVENDFRKMFYAAEQRKEDVGTAPEKSPDLFAWAVIDGERPRACADKFFHACAQGFGAFYSSPRQFRTARLVMTLHLIHRYHESAHAAERMPSLGQLLMPRPQVLTAARLMRVREELPAPAASVPGAEGASESAA
jgi:hypothetical protein